MTYAKDSAQFDIVPDAPRTSSAPRAGGKPRIALMGEFSAGKSTLCNLILGEAVLPMQVTATRLPPVWVTQGDAPAQRFDLHGEAHDLDLSALDRVRADDTQYIKVHASADLLAMCDIIDMPGISDPNMSISAWDSVAHSADAVIWCTHATQAWRQSEAAAWSELPDSLRANSLLLVTRFDKLTDPRDQSRVMQRLEQETGDGFRGIFPISLLAAMQAGEDPDLLQKVGADAFARGLVDLLADLGSLDSDAV